MIADESYKPEKTIVIQTTTARVYIGKDFNIEQNIPFPGLVKITDSNDIYWFNMDHIIWIGPR